MKNTALFALLVTVSASAGAVDSYTIESSHTYPSFRVPHLGISWFTGKFRSTSGKITLDTGKGAGTVDIVIDAASVDFGHDKMNEQVKKENFFNVAQYPQITYKGTLKFDGPTPVAVEGDLTLLGTTRPVPLRINSFKCVVHPMLKREVCGADVEGEFNRRDFGMTNVARDEASGVAKLMIQVEALKD